MNEEVPLVSWIPNLYKDIPPYIQDAIKHEVSSYNLPQDKSKIIADNVYAAVSAHYQFNSDFTSSYASASPEARKKIIKEFIRGYVQDEINIETENAKRKALQELTKNDEGFVWKTLSPKGKTQEDFRKGVTGFLFPDTKDTAETASSSDFKNYGDEIVKKYNETDPTARPSAGSIQTQIDAIESRVRRNLEDVHFNADTASFVGHEDTLIAERVEKAIVDKKLVVRNKKEKAQLIAAVQAGNHETIKKHATLGTRFEGFDDLVKSLGSTYVSELSTRADGTLELKGDGLHEKFKSGVSSGHSQMAGNPGSGFRKTLISNVAGNIADLSVHAATGSISVTTQAQNLITKSKLSADLINLAEASRHIGKMDATALSKFGALKSRVQRAVTAGEIDFRIDADKVKFLNALNNNDHQYLANFVSPGFLGQSDFSRFNNALNQEIMDFGAEVGSKSLASRALNFSNSQTLFQKEQLNQLIYYAQISTDVGYAASEALKKIQEKSFLGKMGIRDTKDLLLDYGRAWEITSNYFKKKSPLSKYDKDFDKIKGFYKDPIGSIRGRLGDELTNWLKKNGVDIAGKFMDSAFMRGLKFKLIKNLRYLEQLGIMALKKLGGPLGSSLSRVLGNSMGGVSRYIAKSFSSIFSFVGNFLYKTSGKEYDFADFAKAAAVVGCGCWLLFFLPILAILQTLLGTFSSNSGTPYLPGVVSDVTFGTFQSYTQNLAFQGGRITTSGNVCVDPNSHEMFNSGRNWNNLKVSDFNGTDNTNNCLIMCNARQVMAGLMPGKDGNLNCNYNFPDMYRFDNPEANGKTQFWCTQLVMNSYKNNDPEITQRSDNAAVIYLDRYLKNKSDMYQMNDLSIPNDPNNEETLSVHSPVCVNKSNFQAGNIVIFRANTCNETLQGGGYKTLTNQGVRTTGNGHVELVLKLSGNYLYTISSNNVNKKLSYQVSSEGCGADQIKVIGTSATYLDENGVSVKYPLLMCRMYQLKNTTGTYSCPSNCQIPTNNYPDLVNSSGGSGGGQ